MNTLTRTLATVASSLALAASGLLFASSPASAATSCFGASCNGLDPATTICQNDARTVLVAGWNEVELRYSPTCRAAWARKSTIGEATVINVTNTAGNSYAANYPGSGTVWTRMVNDKDIQAWACGYWNNLSRYECTGRY
ncbi:DUF2690 domain-containing protein [Streptomyces sp. NPDC059247]|uniref:DUF2690 domain-containing protein n=1 Tax=Streptomyces sp. NPDC059247 TaxID=3346790 RepID=UPI0036AE30A5